MSWKVIKDNGHGLAQPVAGMNFCAPFLAGAAQRESARVGLKLTTELVSNWQSISMAPPLAGGNNNNNRLHVRPAIVSQRGK